MIYKWFGGWDGHGTGVCAGEVRMKIYTRQGDNGSTGLFHGARVSKDAVRIEAYGTVDELSAVLGIVRTHALPADIDQLLQQVQHTLFSVGAELATDDPEAHGTLLIQPAHVVDLENQIDRFEAELPPLRTFILAGGTAAAASLHLARVVCRRAERRVVTLARTDGKVSPTLIAFLNRLGDLLFVIARTANHRLGKPDVPWQKSVGND
jgi:cob(I)alamin adenosyltransferase